tara:strand:+ start:32394 stop:32726 length:333 start_codon:yes stop_codon:yes gene_type:complete
MDDITLFEAIKKHKETCFNKATCNICECDIKAYDGMHLTQCDICGCVYDSEEFMLDEERHYRYDCKCGKTWIYACGKECQKAIPFDIVEEPTDEDAGIYQDICCPLTKGI